MADPSAFLSRRRTVNYARPTHGLEVGTAVTVEATEPVIAVIAPTCEGGSRGNGVLRSEGKPVGAAEPSLADTVYSVLWRAAIGTPRLLLYAPGFARVVMNSR
jgi:hypothetical protein